MIRCNIASLVVLVLTSSAFVFSPGAVCWSHPFHFTTAEMEYNARTNRYEVSIRVLASDLENALAFSADLLKEPKPSHRGLRDQELVDYSRPSDQSSKMDEVNIDAKTSKKAGENTPKSERALLKYLEQNFRIAAKHKQTVDGKTTHPTQPAVLHWVGKEIEQSWVWLYFEIEPPSSEIGLELTNQLFMEINDLQVNTCIIRTAAQRVSLKTEAKNCTVDLPLIFQK